MLVGCRKGGGMALGLRFGLAVAFAAALIGLFLSDAGWRRTLWSAMPVQLQLSLRGWIHSLILVPVTALLQDSLPHSFPVQASTYRDLKHKGYSVQFKHNTRTVRRTTYIEFLEECGFQRRHWQDRENILHLSDPVEVGWRLEDEESTSLSDASAIPDPRQLRSDADMEKEALATLSAAVAFREAGKMRKAARLFEHASALAPRHPDVLNEFGLFLETSSSDLVKAERLYRRALAYEPGHGSALQNRARTLPLVEEIDNRMLGEIDAKREAFLNVPRTSSALRRAMREAYFLHVYHTVAIEGNTMSLVQTRSILESRLAVGGKSVMEHNEILGMDQALRFLNKTLLHRIGDITINDIKEIHHRVLGFVDPIQAGKFRDHQVFVGDFTPVAVEDIEADMMDFIEWLNSEDALSIHPVEMAAIAHYKFVYIHPFVDGNGRTARLLMNLILMQAGFPPVIIRVEDRLDYYETLQAANEGDLRPFIRFIAGATDRTLTSYLAATSASARTRDLAAADHQLRPSHEDIFKF